MLCLAFKSFIPSTVYMKCGTQARTKYIDITHVVQRQGSELCRCLPGLHAFTGCDTLSAFSGKGKLSALRLTKRHVKVRGIFQVLGTEWEVSDELFTGLQEFTCFMYSSSPGTSDVNDLRYRLFCARKGDLDSNQLAPCVDTLRKHCDRATTKLQYGAKASRAARRYPLLLAMGGVLRKAG